MKIIFATGGTGGHLYPAIALAKYLESHYESTEFLFVGTTNRLESKVVPELGYAYKGVHVLGLAGNPLQKMKALAVFAASLKTTKKIVQEFKPDLVIGFGGYVSASIVLSASRLGVKTMIHEQNSIIGLANKILIKHVDEIICCYDLAYQSFPKENTKLLGNPRASAVCEETYNEAILKEYALDENKKTVLVVMGSLGSMSVNEIMKDAVPKFGLKDYQVIFATGKNHFDEVMENIAIIPENVKVVPYINDMLSLLHASNIVVTRAGASTLAELTAIGKPMILIPSPYVAANHQEYNALELVNKNAALMIKEKDLSASGLIQTIDELMNDQAKLTVLSENAKKLGKVNACKDIADEMIKLIESRG